MKITVERKPWPSVPAAAWNETLTTLARKLRLTFAGARPAAGMRHPWQITARHSGRGWEIQIFPGYVNGQETLAPAVSRVFATEPTKDRTTGVRDRVRPWLSELPWIAAPSGQWRSLGTDADAFADGEAVPEFFGALGVGEAPRARIAADYSGVTITEGTMLPPEERRLLRALDVVLSVPKPTVEVGWTESGAGTVDLLPTLAMPGPDDLPSVRVSRGRWEPPAEAPTVQEQLASGRVDARSVERRIGTVYLLSPAGQALGAAVGPAWTPYVAHDLFWNLAMAYQYELDTFPALNLTFSTGLMGGADAIFAGLLAPVNEGDAAAAAFLGRASVTTRLWSV